jgi:two-component system nitrogen regulation sensor histidine kinase NtrY
LLLTQKNRNWRKLRFWLRRRSPSTKADLFIVILSVFIGILTYIALANNGPFSQDPNSIIWILNIDIVMLLLLIVVVGRRILSVWSNRRKRVAASKLHTQLVFTFGILAAVPAILMTTFSAAFFYFGVQAWFSDRVKTAIDNSLTVAEAYLSEHQQVIKADTLALASDFDRNTALLLSDDTNLQRFIQTQSYLRNLPEMVLYDATQDKVIARTELAFDFNADEFENRWVTQPWREQTVLVNSEDNESVHAIVKLKSEDNLFFYVGRPVDERVLKHLEETRSAVDQYSELQNRSSDFQLGLTLIFITVSLLMVLIAVWIGLLIARRLIKPIAQLILTTERVSQGDLSARVDDKVSDRVEEFGTLARAFNHMTEQLDKQHRALIEANSQLDERRRFTETILSGVSSGILGIDENYQISLVNDNAADLFQMTKKSLLKKNVLSIFPEISAALDHAFEDKDLLGRDHLQWLRPDGSKRTFLVRIAITFIGDKDMGAVITFDDITELESAQRKAAWGDVARRVAHEIKNPLTPIQLATERLRRKYKDKFEGEDLTIFDSCTETIIKHVGDIQNMVNEFSSFARMPQIKMTKVNLETLCKEIVVFQKQAHPKIHFESDINLKDKSVILDQNLIHQALTNILKNAIESVQETHKKGGHVKLTVIEKKDIISIAVFDNGAGISDKIKEKISEPYITTKENGSGLGLAIVRRIAEEHKGTLTIQNIKPAKLKTLNFTSGAVVTIQIPREHDI